MFRRLSPALALLLFFPSVAAQPSGDPPAELTAQEAAPLPNGRLLPETGQAHVLIVLEVGCALPPAIEPSMVAFKVESTAPYARVILNPPTVSYQIAPEDCADTAYRQTAQTEAILTTTRDAPAMQPFLTRISATIQDENGEYGPFMAEFELVNDYLPLTLLNPAQLYVKAAPGTTVFFPVELQNLANGPTRVLGEVSQPNKNKLPVVDAGPAVHLESRAMKGAQAAYKAMTEVRVGTPPADGYMNSIFQFNVKYSSVYDGNASGTLATDEQTISFAVQVQGGLGGAAPTLGTPMVLAGLLVLAAVLRRRP